MADDGMLVNFLANNDTPIGKAPVFKGGRWKDRLIARKIATGGRNASRNNGRPSAQQNSNASINKDILAGDIHNISQRPQKRVKYVEAHDTPPKQNTTNASHDVVSSLFSSNPASEKTSEKTSEESAAPEPSNAPLVDGIDTFTSLGLSTALATHLLVKLNLKAPTAVQKSAISQLIKEDSDAFIQAETGSGKTLAYLLPIVQRIMKLSTSKPKYDQSGDNSQVHRDSGLFAIILAPTRELCKQISVVLDSLLHCAHWIVAGTVIGGEKKKSEKARLRKGLNILVATPGRLADHLENTEVLDVSNVQWLVLDEGDRLMELGFEEEIRGIVGKLESRRSFKKDPKLPGLPARRTTVLCSATMKMNVQRLGEVSLKDAVHIQADAKDAEATNQQEGIAARFSAPAQLKQSYIVVPPKQRLVTLAALLKRTFVRQRSVMKSIVFVSCADSVDFHFEIFARPNNREEIKAVTNDGVNSSKDANSAIGKRSSNLLPTISSTYLLASMHNTDITIYKLHGSLTQQLRTATLQAFSRSTNPSILLCTDVASRGLDLPNIDLVVEYDPPFSADDHLHRIGRTARAGKDGRAVIFLMPGAEEGYVDILKQAYRDRVGTGLIRNEAEDVLRKGFGPETQGNNGNAANRGWDERATEWQLDVERWVIDDKRAGELARRAYISHVRAYATHVAKERQIFDVKSLHLGHLAKAFALRERPGNMGRSSSNREKFASRNHVSQNTSRATVNEGEPDAVRTSKPSVNVPMTDQQEASKRMRAKVKEHMTAANEFNIA
ncbi:ATP-dependent RNA helicase dbp7 [Bachmanniomyces sp. S44760]|nr:ATP-dependent RNA helicase dbp7 [Bachmanniomyces sp. S44760]